ncbi:MAG: helix-turn-helix domain-containing protein [Paracoccus sp. (in: a-proteobacteria)]|uniref:helix-turn-helix domain-containing protein n=1 Tax=Paracoccus sp. TaxID=267 RepID=UPI00391C6247
MFQIWTHDVTGSTCAPVYPDGCRDVVIVRQATGRAQVRLTPFDLRPRLAALPAGSHLQGYRLRPGAQISDASLRAITIRPDRAAEIIANDLALSEDADLAIRALCIAGAGVAGVARDLGLSPRSLQRLFQALDLPPPDYWRLLARARQAVRHLGGPLPLAAIAADCGFSDQAHMTREVLRWFGQTPRQLRRDGAALTLLGQPALGNWTGEQISTR